jgi:hypothetical protein
VVKKAFDLPSQGRKPRLVTSAGNGGWSASQCPFRRGGVRGDRFDVAGPESSGCVSELQAAECTLVYSTGRLFAGVPLKVGLDRFCFGLGDISNPELNQPVTMGVRG